MWRIRRALWDALLTFKFRQAKPMVIPAPADDRPIIAVPFTAQFPRIPVAGVVVADHVPRDEAQTLALWFCRFQAWLGRVFSPMGHGLPGVDPDARLALVAAYGSAKRRCYPAPRRPEEFDKGVDLGAVAVASPYAAYLERGAADTFSWDLSSLDGFECHAGVRPPAAQVEFALDESAEAVRAVRIDSDLGVSRPGDADWDAATRLALCAVTTHLSLVRHFNWLHLVAGGPLAIATRNRLPVSHPLRRFLQPHTFATESSNLMVTVVQMDAAGDFTDVFSYTHQGMCRLFEATSNDFDLRAIHPRHDAERRGVAGRLRAPALANRLSLATVIEDHVRRYLGIYYDSDDLLGEDPHLARWLDDLARYIPGGVRELAGDPPTRQGLVDLLTTIVYLVTVEHEIVGSGVWNYQMWSDVQPTRVYGDGRRLPVDVYQRAVNANFNLNVRRTPLMSDFSPLALDANGAAAFRQFLEDLRKLQAELDAEPGACWRMEPRMLKANINA